MAIDASSLPRLVKRAIEQPWITVIGKSDTVAIAVDSRVDVPSEVPVGWPSVRTWG